MLASSSATNPLALSAVSVSSADRSYYAQARHERALVGVLGGARRREHQADLSRPRRYRGRGPKLGHALLRGLAHLLRLRAISGIRLEGVDLFFFKQKTAYEI